MKICTEGDIYCTCLPLQERICIILPDAQLMIRDVIDTIDTIGKKGVLLLGRFTEGRLAVLERLPPVADPCSADVFGRQHEDS